jgi:hypothetical protein
MRSAILPAHARFQVAHLAALAALPALALVLLPARCVAAVPHAGRPSDSSVANQVGRREVGNPSETLGVQLAQNKKKKDDDDFDPYGKDDPTNKKWGEAAGLGGNRYGGLRTNGDAKKEKAEKNADREEPEPRRRGEDGGKN